MTIAQSFASGKAAGYDNILMSVIKESIQIISGPLAHIMNLSLLLKKNQALTMW